MTPNQCKEARRLLRWSQFDLALEAGVQTGVISQYERIGRPTQVRNGFDWLEQVRSALGKAGITFVEGTDKGVSLWGGYAVTPSQCVEARQLLGITQVEVGRAIGVSAGQISDFERAGHMARLYQDTQDRLRDLRGVFETAGVEFTNGDAPGVRLRK